MCKKLNFLLGLYLVSLLLGCAQHGAPAVSYQQLPPLELPGQTLFAEQALERADDDSILGLNEAMLEFTEPFISKTTPREQRVRMLHQLILSQAFLDFEYQAGHSYTAAQAFDQTSGNCISFANLFIALARHYGLDARYQLMEINPLWDKQGKQVEMSVHVNVLVKMRGAAQYTIDVTPRAKQGVTAARVISDRKAAALYYNNIAMQIDDERETARVFSLLVKSLSLSPETDFLWANIGTLYRQAGQWQDAETIYQQAIRLNPDSHAAMNNLAVLYQKQGETLKAQVYIEKIRQQKDNNPYYYFFLAEEAEKNGDYLAALDYLAQAIRRKPDWPELYYRKSKIYFQMQRYSLSMQSIQQALEGSEGQPHRQYLRQLELLQNLSQS